MIPSTKSLPQYYTDQHQSNVCKILKVLKVSGDSSISHTSNLQSRLDGSPIFTRPDWNIEHAKLPEYELQQYKACRDEITPLQSNIHAHSSGRNYTNQNSLHAKPEEEHYTGFACIHCHLKFEILNSLFKSKQVAR